jgi:adenylate kinase family enzyme
MRPEVILPLECPRIAIVGGPRTGKTTLAATVTDRPIIHTDDYIGVGWDAAPEVLNATARMHERFVIEGVQVARCLRKGLEVDHVIVLLSAKRLRTPRQVAMAKGVYTVFREWRGANPHIPVTVVASQGQFTKV